MANSIQWETWITFMLICVISIIILFCIIVIICVKHLSPIKSKNVPLLLIMAISGLIHIWAVVIANGHFPWLSYIEHTSCVFWNYWFQYFFGLCPWFIAITIRLITYGCTFSRYLTDIGYERIRNYKWIFILLTEILPLFIILIFITITKGSYFDESIHKCQSLIEFKLILLIWIIIIGLILILFMCFINLDIIDDCAEFKAISQIIFFGIIVVFFNGFITFLDLKNNTYIRPIATLSVALFHIFSLLRICGLCLYKLIINDQTYVQNFDIIQDNQKLNLFNITEIKDDNPEIFKDFIDYCEDKPLIKTKSTKQIIIPSNLVLCYKEIQTWKELSIYNSNDVDHNKKLKEKHINIINQFLLNTTTHPNPKYIHFENSVTELMNGDINSKDLFKEIEKWIINNLNVFFGLNYLQRDIYQRSIYIDNEYLRDKFIDIQSKKSKKRQKKEKLIDVPISDYSFSNDNISEMTDLSHKKKISMKSSKKKEKQMLIIKENNSDSDDDSDNDE